MPSANMNATMVVPASLGISAMHAKDVEGLVLEIKENLRISAVAHHTLKAIPSYRRSFPKKYLRNSPYDPSARRLRQKTPAENDPEDPYELLQRLLKDGGLVSEAVRRVQLGLAAAAASKQQQCFYYDSDPEEGSPVLC